MGAFHHLCYHNLQSNSKHCGEREFYCLYDDIYFRDLFTTTQLWTANIIYGHCAIEKFMVTSSAAAKEAVVTEGALAYFTLAGQQALSNSSNNASKAIAELYSSNEAASALFYWLNLTLLKIKILIFGLMNGMGCN